MVQITQISNIEVISFMVDFLKTIKLWHLSIEFFGEWSIANITTVYGQ